jgi:hypothetical protein
MSDQKQRHLCRPGRLDDPVSWHWRKCWMSRMIRLLVLATGPLLMSCTSAPGFKGEVSDHFDGKQFSNNQPMDKSAGDSI